MTTDPGIWEYDVDCETCGHTFPVGLTVPADTIDPESLARLVDALHAPTCPGPHHD